jgi:hypothetical protein
MIVLFIVAMTGVALIALGGVACVAVRLTRRRRMAHHSWSRFEKQFREYARRSAEGARGTDR